VREDHHTARRGRHDQDVLLRSGLKAGGDSLELAARQAAEQVSTEIANLRALISELRPAALDELGLVAAIEGLARRAREVEGLDATTELELDEEALDAELKTAVYRLVQEALTNVAKHARAQNVAVTVRQEEGAVQVRVADDGAGFDALEPTGGFGLAGMHERTALMNGELDVRTSPSGTVIEARFPV
jgi:signal transduction histidine kinase